MRLSKRQIEILELISNGNGEILRYVSGSGEVRLRKKWVTKTLFNCYSVGYLICFQITKRTFMFLLENELIREQEEDGIMYTIDYKGKQYLESLKKEKI